VSVSDTVKVHVPPVSRVTVTLPVDVVSYDESMRILEKYDGRVFVIGGDYQEVLSILYGSTRSKQDQLRRLSRLFHSKVAGLNNQRIGPAALMGASLVVGDEGVFDNHLLGNISRQFIEKSPHGMSKTDILRTHVLFGLTYVSADLLREPPEELEVHKKRGDVFEFFFRSDFMELIADAMEAFRRIAIAA